MDFLRAANAYLQFLQPFALLAPLDAFAEPFACFAFALALLSLASDILSFALDLVFSIFTPFRAFALILRAFAICF